ncbi:cyclopropane-fatty-acyl-phospholipid synthase [Nitzschia inconspicua]|uniref:Cyclopropane-fatty-acyl-phospholipid synthase n=1 Tax=Nitzschia inconspicua TaxID=303405 RepID=A0A9K3KQA9_9STRA|nr:cyclopropane-fatty-acyl-phospholipid synthase [Nitzschia inconspicua]
MCKGEVPPASNGTSVSFNGTTTPRRVAIVGGGVAGLSAAWHLAENCPDIKVELFEAEDRLGGHAYTIPVNNLDGTGKTNVDIGFMVFNESNYPNIVNWFEKLGIPSENTDMSLSVSLDKGDTIEWNSDGINGLLARRGQAADPQFYAMLYDMHRFNKEAVQLLLLADDDPRKAVTTGQYLRAHGYSQAFGMYYLLPMMAALWSASMKDVLAFPAVQLISFLCNHKMLQLLDRPQWKTVSGRSQTYTNKLKHVLGSRAHLSTPIASMSRKYDDSLGRASPTYELFTKDAVSVGTFDEVIFACHTDTTTRILKTCKGPEETVGGPSLIDTLSEIVYADNVIYVHSDLNLMPARRRAWASWNCMGNSETLREAIRPFVKSSQRKGEAFEGAESGFGNKAKEIPEAFSAGEIEVPVSEGTNQRMKAVYVTYWLNRLQNLETNDDIFVSLNPHTPPDPTLTHLKTKLAHPQFTASTLQARRYLAESFQGKEGLWFCGAWQGYGFHEDGCRSGFEVAAMLSGVSLPWAEKNALVLPSPDLAQSTCKPGQITSFLGYCYQLLTRDLPVAACKRFVMYFLNKAVTQGRLQLRMNDGSMLRFGDGSPCGCDENPVTLRVFDEWLFVKIAWEYDLGLARSYMAGHFIVEPLHDPKHYNQVLRPANERDETNVVIGDPVGLTRLLLLLIGNRDLGVGEHVPSRSCKGYSGANAINAGLMFSKIGSFLNFIRYRLTMDNSERGGSLKNIHAHYDLSNDLFTSFLDRETLMYSSAIYDAVKAPWPQRGLVFRGTLEEAQWRKLDTLLDRAQVLPGQNILDIGFGWGGLSIHAAKKYGCMVTGITLSVEQRELATRRVKAEGLQHLITFEVIDYRTFARRKDNRGKFDRVLSCEMIEAVGHDHLTEFYWAVEQVLAPDGVLVMEAITTTEERYENYLHSTDFINTIIFPGSCCPCLHALVDAAYKGSRLTLEHIDNIGLHYAKTLADWRRRFNANENFVRGLGFDDIFLRAWNYYLSYCEAGFYARNVNCLILVFARQGCKSLTPLHETRSCTQLPALSDAEVQQWISEA